MRLFGGLALVGLVGLVATSAFARQAHKTAGIKIGV